MKSRFIWLLSITAVLVLISIAGWHFWQSRDGPRDSLTISQIRGGPSSASRRGADAPSVTYKAGQDLLPTGEPFDLLHGISLELLNPDLASRDTLLALLENLTPENLGEILAIYESALSGHPRADVWHDLLIAWSRFEPSAAYQYGVTNTLGGDLTHEATMANWLQADEPAVKAFLSQLEGEIPERMHLLYAMPSLLSRDEDAAIRWVEELPNGHMKQRALSLVALHSVKEADAREFLETGEWLKPYAAQPVAGEAVGNLAAEWVVVDHQAAWQWLESLPAGKAKEQGVADFTSRWAGEDPAAAGDWLNAMEPGPSLDPALAAYALLFSYATPEVAIDWSLSITEERLRKETTQRVYERWLRSDPVAAQEWLGSD